ncbi:hypothetical protein D9X30_4908 [Cupriavidus sp. U2]|uniref:hypothetical protein n=1 Tax=Cupriavidus sp. U2 TaxID=2920269 RepID=UPI00129E7CA0|nr:hypothetical protein [Cupriavidus sp. U2]KAI3589325.1 hypothetical protein D9X30_4908 [Cupriavidus sp. U2]
MTIDTRTLVVVAVLLGAAGVVFLAQKKSGAAAAAAGGALGEAAGQAIVGAGTGLVFGIGDAVGVPRTDETECERAKREGRTWDASFACGAGDFLSYLWR